ncbi:restriction endonuclease subunit S [Helicobacter winghamensis]|uniref:restriction endonuclease subunit S n=1 Tax=Helicobacter winghamensis TaxID=157268 RepID=UPI00242E82DD|nr:restriction endonuclease subunit S [Helicobacter winghamensis]
MESFLQSLHKEQWQEVRLGEVAEINPKETLRKHYLYKKVAMDNLEPYTKKVYSFGIESFNGGAKFRNGDTLLARITPCLENGKTAFVDFLQDDEIAFGSTEFIVLREKATISDKDFLYYLARSKHFREVAIKSMTGSSGRERVQIEVLRDFTFLLPPLTIQQKIAEILSSFDDKIDLLHRQNKTLESLALTLFRHYSTYKELDSIIGDIVALQSGYAFKSKDFQNFGKDRILKIKNIQNSIIDIINTDFINENISKILDSKFRIFGGDILFGMTGAEIGKMGIVPKNNETLWLNQRVGVLRGKFKGAKYLAYLHLTSAFGFDYIINAASGSAQPNISAKDIENCPFYCFTESELQSISSQISPFFEKIIQNSGAILTLQAMRDILLKAIFA